MRHGRDVKESAGFQLNYPTIIESNCRGSRKNEPDMFNRTTRRADTRANVLAPFPPGLIGRATNGDSTEVDQLEFPFPHHAHFIRRVERFQNDRYLLTVHWPINMEMRSQKSKQLFEFQQSFVDWEKRFEAGRFGAGKIEVARESWVIVRIRLPAVSGVILFPVKAKINF